MPLVIVPSRPNGLPIATTPSPTSTSSESPRRSGSRNDAGASTLITARSVERSVPTSSALRVEPSEKRTVIELEPLTTCSFVTMWPCSSSTKPEPCACWPPLNAPPPVAEISTTPFTEFR